MRVGVLRLIRRYYFREFESNSDIIYGKSIPSRQRCRKGNRKTGNNTGITERAQIVDEEL